MLRKPFTVCTAVIQEKECKFGGPPSQSGHRMSVVLFGQNQYYLFIQIADFRYYANSAGNLLFV